LYQNQTPIRGLLLTASTDQITERQTGNCGQSDCQIGLRNSGSWGRLDFNSGSGFRLSLTFDRLLGTTVSMTGEQIIGESDPEASR
jgi:hypothetical protein